MSCRHGKIWYNRSIDLDSAVQSHWIQSKETNSRLLLPFISFIETVGAAGNSKRWCIFKDRGERHSKTKKKKAKWKASKQVEEALKRVFQLLGRKDPKLYEPLKTRAQWNAPHPYSTLR